MGCDGWYQPSEFEIENYVAETPTCEDCGSDLETGDEDAALCPACRALNAQAEVEAALGRWDAALKLNAGTHPVVSR